MDSFFGSDQFVFRNPLGRWMREPLAPRAEQLDRTGELARGLFEELATLSYLGTMYPGEYGGVDLQQPYLSYANLYEELARANMAFAATVYMHRPQPTQSLNGGLRVCGGATLSRPFREGWWGRLLSRNPTSARMPGPSRPVPLRSKAAIVSVDEDLYVQCAHSGFHHRRGDCRYLARSVGDPSLSARHGGSISSRRIAPIPRNPQ